MLVTAIVNAHEALLCHKSSRFSPQHVCSKVVPAHIALVPTWLCQGAAATAPAGSDTCQAALLAPAQQVHPTPMICYSQKRTHTAPMLTCFCQGAAAAPLACSRRDRAEGDPLVGVQSSHESIHSCAHSLQQAHAICGCS